MKDNGFTAELWQQLWTCTSQLKRELKQTPEALCWPQKPLVVPSLRPYSASPQTSPAVQNTTPYNIEKQISQISQTLADQRNSNNKDRKFTAKQAKDKNKVTAPNLQSAANILSYLGSGTGEQYTYPAASLCWQDAITACEACNLGQPNSRIRQQAIIGQGADKQPRLLLVCDAPNYEADRVNLPLAPNQLEYLHKWLVAIRMERSYYLTNLVKCRTPGGRAAWPEEVKRCLAHLEKQLTALQPQAILALGSSAARALSQQRSDMETLRSRELYYCFRGRNIPLFVTYSVAEVLQNLKTLRRPVWQDLQRLQTCLQCL